MNVKISSVNAADINGGCLVGYIEDIDPNKLVKMLGHPKCLIDIAYKSDWEWVIDFDNGDQLYIYDWKIGKNYRGSSGLNFEEITTWNIGGSNETLARQLSSFLKSKEWSSFDDIRMKLFMTEEYIETIKNNNRGL